MCVKISTETFQIIWDFTQFKFIKTFPSQTQAKFFRRRVIFNKNIYKVKEVKVFLIHLKDEIFTTTTFRMYHNKTFSNFLFLNESR